MKKIILIFICLAMLSCGDEERKKVKKDIQTVVHSGEYIDYSLVSIDDEVFIVRDFDSNDNTYRVFPLHREGEYLYVKAKYLKPYKTKK